MSTLKKSGSQLPNQEPQTKPLPKWLIRLLIVASLAITPTLVAAFSKDTVSFHFKAWGIEYEFYKQGNQTPPNQW